MSTITLPPEIVKDWRDPSKEKLGDRLGNCPDATTSIAARQKIGRLFIGLLLFVCLWIQLSQDKPYL